jgi:hypothetical protein
MATLFYIILVIATPVEWSWLWFVISLFFNCGGKEE